MEAVTTGAAVDEYASACRRPRASKRRSEQHSSAWPDFLPPVALSDGPLGAVQAADREIARQTVIRARAVAEFAALRPASADQAQGEPGAMSPERWAARPEILRGVSEWAAQELVVALSISSQAAETLLVRSLTLVHRLPGTLAALEAGALHSGHLWPMLEKVAPIEDPTVRAEVEAGLLRWAAGRVTTPAQLGARARREVARRDARAAARRLEKAIRERGVHVGSGHVDGLAAVTAVLTDPEALALHRALAAYADAIEDDPDGRPRTRGQKMADCLLDLVLRPGDTELPPVQVLLTVVASLGTLAGGDDPGEVDGRVVPAEMVRELLRLLGPEGPSRATRTDDGEASTPASSSFPPAQGADERSAPVCVDGSASRDALPSQDRIELSGATPQPAWPQLDQEELERWWAETERRVLSGELDTGPEPLVDAESVARTSPDPGPPGWQTFDLQVGDLEPPDLESLDWEARDPDPPDRGRPDQELLDQELSDQEPPDHEPPRQEPPDHEPPGQEPPDHEPPGQEQLDSRSSADEPGWWAAVDRALDDTGRVLREADRALSRAGQLMRTALTKDAADEAAWQAGSGRFTDADDALAVLRACTDSQRERLGDLLSTTGGGGLAERPRIALTDALSGALLALTDLPEMRRVGACGARLCRRDPARCSHDLTHRPGLGPPGPTDGYRPSASLDRWVRARDRRCRFPGCRRRVPRGGELDHACPYPLGPTSAANLTGYCTGHHRGKHQAPGWQHTLASDGTLTVTTPTGLTAVTRPAPY